MKRYSAERSLQIFSKIIKSHDSSKCFFFKYENTCLLEISKVLSEYHFSNSPTLAYLLDSKLPICTAFQTARHVSPRSRTVSLLPNRIKSKPNNEFTITITFHLRQTIAKKKKKKIPINIH